MFISCVSSYVVNLLAGWICKMLRTHRHGHEGNFCGQNRCQIIASKTPSEGKGIRLKAFASVSKT